jgi:hypothetical protein
MSVFHVFAVRALFPRVSVMSQGTKHVLVKLSDAMPFLPNMPVFHIVAVRALFPRDISAMPQGHECVRFKLSDPRPFFPDMPFFQLSLSGRCFHAFGPCSRVTNMTGSS